MSEQIHHPPQDFAEVWQNYCRAKPKLRTPDAKVQMTAQQFQTALELAWQSGERVARRHDPFSGLFGGRKP